jgi:hypothetical protein
MRDTGSSRSTPLWWLMVVPVLLILIGAALWIWAPLLHSRIRIQNPTEETQRLLDELVRSREAVIQPRSTQELQRQLDDLVRSREGSETGSMPFRNPRSVAALGRAGRGRIADAGAGLVRFL